MPGSRRASTSIDQLGSLDGATLGPKPFRDEARELQTVMGMTHFSASWSQLAGLRVLLLDDGQRRSPLIRMELIRLRCQLVEVLDSPAELPAAIARQSPELVIIDSATPSPALLAAVAEAQHAKLRPVLLLAEDANGDTMRAALKADICLLGVLPLQAQKLGALLELALIRFEHDQEQRQELQRVRHQLAERKDVERAKGILMREQGLDEEAAYQRLRRLSMDGGLTLGAMAQRLIDAQTLLKP